MATAEAMVNEALCMGAEAAAVGASLVNVAEVAERRASQLECALWEARTRHQAQLDQTRQHNDCENTAREAAELRAERTGSRCGKQQRSVPACRKSVQNSARDCLKLQTCRGPHGL